MNKREKKVGIKVGKVQVRDFCGPWEVFGISFSFQWVMIRRFREGERVQQ